MQIWLFLLLASLLNVSCLSKRIQVGEGAPVATKIKTQVSGLRLSSARQMFSLAVIDRETALITGGFLGNDPKANVLKSAELLEPKVGISPLQSQMQVARWGHSSTVLRDGTVFICGGSADLRCERYLNQGQKFLDAGRLTQARGAASQLLLSDGRVLITGGYNQNENSGSEKVLKSAEVYDPQTQKIRLIGNMVEARAGHFSFEHAGMVFVWGGPGEGGATVEVLDLKEPRGTFRFSKMRLPFAIKDFRAQVLGAQVFLVGGTKSDGNSSSSIIRMDFEKEKVEVLSPELTEPREDLTLCALDRSGVRFLALGGEIKGHGKDGKHSPRVEYLKLEPLSIEPIRLDLYRDDASTFPLGDEGCLVLGGSDREGNADPSILHLSL